jgi:hypothetical protein
MFLWLPRTLLENTIKNTFSCVSEGQNAEEREGTHKDLFGKTLVFFVVSRLDE